MAIKRERLKSSPQIFATYLDDLAQFSYTLMYTYVKCKFIKKMGNSYLLNMQIIYNLFVTKNNIVCLGHSGCRLIN